MRNERPVPIEREQLGFAAAAKSAFAFLLSHGFRVVDEQITWVRYESNILFVNGASRSRRTGCGAAACTLHSSYGCKSRLGKRRSAE